MIFLGTPLNAIDTSKFHKSVERCWRLESKAGYSKLSSSRTKELHRLLEQLDKPDGSTIAVYEKRETKILHRMHLSSSHVVVCLLSMFPLSVFKYTSPLLLNFTPPLILTPGEGQPCPRQPVQRGIQGPRVRCRPSIFTETYTSNVRGAERGTRWSILRHAEQAGFSVGGRAFCSFGTG